MEAAAAKLAASSARAVVRGGAEMAQRPSSPRSSGRLQPSQSAENPFSLRTIEVSEGR